MLTVSTFPWHVISFSSNKNHLHLSWGYSQGGIWCLGCLLSPWEDSWPPVYECAGQDQQRQLFFGWTWTTCQLNLWAKAEKLHWLENDWVSSGESMLIRLCTSTRNEWLHLKYWFLKLTLNGLGICFQGLSSSCQSSPSHLGSASMSHL